MSVIRSSIPATSLWLIFFVNGAVLSSWAPRIPEVKHTLGLSDSQLGTALLGIAAGSVPALLLTARLLRHVRPGPVCVISALAFSAALPLISRSGSVRELTAVLIVLGAVSGVLDVAMNSAGIAYQQRHGTTILSHLHGGYSLGALAGAGGGVIATTTHASVAAHFLLVGALLLALTLVATPALWTQPADSPSAAPMRIRRQRRRWQPMLPGTIAVLAVSGLLIEGLITDWSALLITRDLGAPTSWGAAALVAFSIAMFISRSLGDAAVARLGEERVLAISALTITMSMVLGVGLGQPPLMVACAGVIGLVLGPLFPLAVTRASRSAPGQEAAMTARVSAVGYIAYLAGPPLIGVIADHVTLPTALVLVVGLACVGIAATAHDKPGM